MRAINNERGENSNMNHLKEIRKQTGLTQKNLAAAVGLKSGAAVSFYETEGRKIPLEIGKKMSKALNCSFSYLMGFDNDSYSEPLPVTWMPISGTIRAGLPNLCQEDIEGYIPISGMSPTNTITLKIKGNSMNLTNLKDGTVVCINREETVNNGDFAAVQIDGNEATIKRFYQDGDKVILQPCSSDPSFQNMIYDINKTDVKIIGKVVKVMVDPV